MVDMSSESHWTDMATLDRVAWTLYALIFLVIPFAVLLFRHDMLAWHYYAAGATILAGALAICAINLMD